MVKIKIISDKSGSYESGIIILQIDFISKYLRAYPNDPKCNYLTRIPMPAAAEYIAETLGIKFEYVS